MPIKKTSVEPAIVQNYLESNFSPDISNLAAIKAGELSQAFSFVAQSKHYIIRVNTKNISFLKDDYAYKHFHSNIIPIPQILQMGAMNNQYFYAISPRVEGKTLDEWDHETNMKLLPEMITIMENMHEIDISKTTGYGTWNEDGNAAFSSWKDAVIETQNNELFDWAHTYSFTGDKEYFRQVFQQIEMLSTYVPEERKLLHADYGFNNMVSDGVSITGVLDWGESSYGDPVFDIAWMDFWSSDIKYGEEFKKYYDKKRIHIDHYWQRMYCYELKVGVESLALYASPEKKEEYKWTKFRVDNVLQKITKL